MKTIVVVTSVVIGIGGLVFGLTRSNKTEVTLNNLSCESVKIGSEIEKLTGIHDVECSEFKMYVIMKCQSWTRLSFTNEGRYLMITVSDLEKYKGLKYKLSQAFCASGTVQRGVKKCNVTVKTEDGRVLEEKKW